MELERSILDYSMKLGYRATKIDPVICPCGSDEFYLESDDGGGAVCICALCKEEKDIQGSREFIEEPVQNICTCDSEKFDIAVGLAFYDASDDIRWVYVGAKCTNCGLAGVYVDWCER